MYLGWEGVISRLIRKPEDLPVYREFGYWWYFTNSLRFLAEGLSKLGAKVSFYNELKDFLFYGGILQQMKHKK